MNEIETQFRKIFGDMYLSESETALRIFEYGYKAGVAAENEACAKLCELMADNFIRDEEEARADASEWCAAAIRERMK